MAVSAGMAGAVFPFVFVLFLNRCGLLTAPTMSTDCCPAIGTVIPLVQCSPAGSLATLRIKILVLACLGPSPSVMGVSTPTPPKSAMSPTLLTAPLSLPVSNC